MGWKKSSRREISLPPWLLFNMKKAAMASADFSVCENEEEIATSQEWGGYGTNEKGPAGARPAVL